jgi:hypothetical protein
MFQKSDFLKKVGRNTIAHAITFALVNLQLNSAMLNYIIYIQHLSAASYSKQSIHQVSCIYKSGYYNLTTKTLALC